MAFQHVRRTLSESLGEVLAEAAEIAEAAGEADAGHRAAGFSVFEHAARVAQPDALGELKWRVAPALLEGAEDAADAGAGHLGHRIDLQRLVPMGGDIGFRASHLPG